MSNLNDEKIKKMLHESQPDLPIGYEQKINNIVNHLGERTDKKHFILRRVIVASAFCLILSAGGVYAASNYVSQRMQDMDNEEIKKYNEDVQSAEVNADNFNRELSEQEQERKNILANEYNSEGRFPNSSVMEISDLEEIDENTLCFHSSTSTFYLPNRDLTDEEILELIDFYYKRDYSVQISNQTEKSKLEEETKNISSTLLEKAAITQKEAVSIATKYVNDIFGEDVSNISYGIEISENFDRTKTYYGVSFSSDEMQYSVEFDAEDGKLFLISCGSDYHADGISVNEEFYINQYPEIKEFFGEKISNTENIKNVYLEYKTESNEYLSHGTVKYSFEMKDGSGYFLLYSCSKERIVQIMCTDEYALFDNSSDVEKAKALGITRHQVELE
ncbi:hypothetical protein [Anaerosporobacter sp.]|uniref:hypothetical protein n=1 Tax=Anaerosporobacter sp. TaxID=1872529 RepID=UPI00286F412E|nr:hypothetical protein [Anaerosporobacter sp.]